MFDKELIICVNDTEIKFNLFLSTKKELIEHINKKYNINDTDILNSDGEDKVALTFNGILKDDSDEMYNFVWFNSESIKEDDLISIMVHESSHMAYSLVVHNDLPLSIEDSESLAYMTEGIFTLMMEAIMEK